MATAKKTKKPAKSKKKAEEVSVPTGTHPLAHNYKLWLHSLEDRVTALEKKLKSK